MVCFKQNELKLFYCFVRRLKYTLLNEGSDDVVFNCSGMGILNIDLNNINFDDKFDEHDPDTIILIRLLAWHPDR